MKTNYQKIFVNTLTNTNDKEIQILPSFSTVVSTKLLSVYLTDNIRKNLQGLEITTDGHIILKFQKSKLLAVCHHGEALVSYETCNMQQYSKFEATTKDLPMQGRGFWSTKNNG